MNGGSMANGNGTPTALDRARVDNRKLTATESEHVSELGEDFLKICPGNWLMICGRFMSEDADKGIKSTESRLRALLCSKFGYPNSDGPDQTINVLLDSPGGSLDSAYQGALYLAEYAKEFNVYVPGRAKSASTLFALGADKIYLSSFGELGPLDTQIADPRNPANTVSALDCYQSVDYVRDFAFKTIEFLLPKLVDATERRISISGLLQTASDFAVSEVKPVVGSVSALDFGGWGRSLRIGEQYAQMLLQSKKVENFDDIAHELVYGFPHHLFTINRHLAERIGLNVELMTEDVYKKSLAIVEACQDKDAVGFLGEDDFSPDGSGQPSVASRPAPPEVHAEEHARAEVDGGLD